MQVENFLQRIGRQRDAFGAADTGDLLAGRGEIRLDIGIVAQRADRLARQRGHAGIGGEQDELHPELGDDGLA